MDRFLAVMVLAVGPLAAQDALVRAIALEAELLELEKQAGPERDSAIQERVRHAAELLQQVPEADKNHEVMRLRWELGKRAFNLNDFSISVRLFRDVEAFTRSNFAGDRFHFEVLRLLAASHGSLQELAEAERIQEELVRAWDARQGHLVDATLARLDLSISLLKSGPAGRERARVELQRALTVVRQHSDRFDCKDVWTIWLNLAESHAAKEKVDVLEECQLYFGGQGRKGRPYQLAATNQLAATLGDLGQRREAIASLRRVMAELEGEDPQDAIELARAQNNLAYQLSDAGIHSEAAVHCRAALARIHFQGQVLAAMPASSVEVRDIKANLARALLGMGDSAAAHQVARELADEVSRHLPPGHPNRLFHLGRLSWFAEQDDRNDEALQVARQMVAEAERLPETHTDRRSAELRLAGAMAAAGQELQAVAIYERTGSKRNLAGVLARLGLWDDAMRIYREYAAGFETSLPMDQLELTHEYQWTLLRIAELHRNLGQFSRALQLQEQVLQTRRRIMPEDSFYVGFALRQQATTRIGCGDFAGAQAQLRESVAIMERCMAPNARALLGTRIALGWCDYWLGEAAAAANLSQGVRDSLIAAGRTDYEEYLIATAHLGWYLVDLGRLEEANGLLQEVVAATATRQAAPDILVQARMNLGRLYLRQRRAAEGLDLLRDALAWLEANEEGRIVAPFARRHLLQALDAAGDLEAVRDGMQRLVHNARQRLVEFAALAPRELAEAAGYLRLDAELALAIHARRPDAIKEADLFELLESLRAACGPPTLRLLKAGTGRVEEQRRRAIEARRRVASLQSADDDQARDPTLDTRLLEHAIRERDLRLQELLAAAGPDAAFRFVTVSDVAASLPRDAAAIGLHRFRDLAGTSHYAAIALGRDGKAVRADLGRADEIDQLVREWRGAVQSPVRGRVQPDPQSDPAVLGDALRTRVLGPIQALLPCRCLLLCLDGDLHLVPWDALPEGGRLVGDLRTLVVLPSMLQLTEKAQAVRARESLLAIGGIDYNAEVARPPGVIATTADAPYPLRGGGPGSFPPIPGSRDEVTRIEASFSARFGKPGELLLGADATKQALFAKAPTARYLHVATHGYFSDGPGGAGAESRNSYQQLVTALAPMTLCGLALAGANRGSDRFGSVAGIVTAEELAGLDLRNCSLAVLSGCETNVGLRRAGQGLASLQAALHSAGARTAVTSLWPVGDEETKELMGKFYTHLWGRKEPPAKALWLARMEVRKAGRPQRDWAGWVLTGSPD